MICKDCGNEFSEGIFCPECGAKYEAAESISKENERKDKVPFFLRMWFIVVVGILSSTILFLPAIALFIARLVKYPQKRKSAVIGAVVCISVLAAIIIGVVYYEGEDDRAIEKYVESGNYEGALKYIEEHISREYSEYYTKKADIYEKKGDYDSAAQIIMEYCAMQEDMTEVSSGIENRLSNYRELVSADTALQIDDLMNSITHLRAEKEREELLKKEAEETAKVSMGVDTTSDEKQSDTENVGTAVANDIEWEYEYEDENIYAPYSEYNDITDNTLYTLHNGWMPEYNIKKRNKVLKLIFDIEGNKYADAIMLEGKLSNILTNPKVTLSQTIDEWDADYCYFGGMKNNKPNGQGVLFSLRYDDNFVGHIDRELPRLVYAGGFKNGRVDGYGIIFRGTAPYAEGEFDDGLLNGKGIMYYENTSLSRTGEDDLTVNISAVFELPRVYYEGDFKNGKPDGKGTTYYTSIFETTEPYGAVEYTGKFAKGDFSGKGKVYYASGQLRYEGEFKNGRYHGKGTLYKEDGSVEYKGKFKNGDIAK